MLEVFFVVQPSGNVPYLHFTVAAEENSKWAYSLNYESFAIGVKLYTPTPQGSLRENTYPESSCVLSV